MCQHFCFEGIQKWLIAATFLFSGLKAYDSISGFCGRDRCQVLMCETSEGCQDFLPAMEGSRCSSGAFCYRGECTGSKNKQI